MIWTAYHVHAKTGGPVLDAIAIPSTRVPVMERAMRQTVHAYVMRDLSHRRRTNRLPDSLLADGAINVPTTGSPKGSARVSVTPTPRTMVPYTRFPTINPGLDVGDTAHARGMANRWDVNAMEIQTPTSIVPNVYPHIIPNTTGLKIFPMTRTV